MYLLCDSKLVLRTAKLLILILFIYVLCNQQASFIYSAITYQKYCHGPLDCVITIHCAVSCFTYNQNSGKEIVTSAAATYFSIKLSKIHFRCDINMTFK